MLRKLFNLLIRNKTIYILFGKIFLRDYRFKYISKREFDVGYGSISSFSKILIPITEVYGILYSSSGYKKVNLTDTPHYKFISNYSEEGLEEYKKYLEKYHSDIDIEKKISEFKNLKIAAENNPKDFFLLIKKEVDLLENKEAKIIDGLHRATILKTINQDYVVCYIVDKITYN